MLYGGLILHHIPGIRVIQRVDFLFGTTFMCVRACVHTCVCNSFPSTIFKGLYLWQTFSMIWLCKRESASSSSCLSFPLFVHFSFSPIFFFSSKDFSAPIESQSSNFVYTHRGLKYMYKILLCWNLLCRFFSSPEVISGWAIVITFCPSFVRPCVRRLTFSNDFSSEAAEQILLKFYMEPP